MKIHLQWLAPFRDGDSEAINTHLVIVPEKKYFQYTLTQFVASQAIEVKRKSDLAELREELLLNGYTERF